MEKEEKEAKGNISVNTVKTEGRGNAMGPRADARKYSKEQKRPETGTPQEGVPETKREKEQDSLKPGRGPRVQRKASNPIGAGQKTAKKRENPRPEGNGWGIVWCVRIKVR